MEEERRQKAAAFLKPLIGSPDLTEGNKRCASKALFAYLGDEMGMSELELFESYLRPFTMSDEDCNVSALDRSTGTHSKAVKWFYRFSHPGLHPQYFNFAYYHDLNKLGEALNLELVVYSTDSVCNPTRLQLFHDFRGVAPCGENSKKTIYFLYDAKKRLAILKACPDFWFEEHLPAFANYNASIFYWATNGLDPKDKKFLREEEDCFKCLAERALGLPARSCRAEGNTRVVHLSDFIDLGSQLYKEWNIPALLVTFCHQENPRSHAPAQTMFTTLCCVGEGSTSAEKVADWNLKDPRVKVVCFYASKFACVLSSPYQKAMIQRHFDTVIPSSKATRDAPETAGLKKLISKERREEAIRALEESKSAFQKRLNKIEKTCKCSICKDKSFDLNMSWAGPEKLVTTNYTVKDLLQLLGAWNENSESLLDQLSEYSLASMDIESKTLEVHSENPQPGPQVPYAEIDSSQLRSHTKKIQKPLMIAHTDGLCPEMGVFTVRDNSEQAIYDMMATYWNFVLDSHVRTSAYKQSLAKPLYDLVEPYKVKFFEVAEQCSQELWQQRQNQERKLAADYFETGDKTVYDEGYDRLDNPNLSLRITTSEACAAWKQTLPGRLEEALDRLVKSYVIFSFYGSGYDHVLLSSYLVPQLFEQGYNPQLERKGNKVSQISISTIGISFRDVTKLLAPSTNLRNFGKLFNLEQSKAHFPFKILTGLEALNLPRLPQEVDAWIDDLFKFGRGITSQDELEIKNKISEAEKLFEEAGCQTVGDYLRHYLKLDVQILYDATQGWRRQLYRLVGIDFVASQKFTISSLSYTAGLKFAERKARIGNFFPNNSQHYRLLRQGMRGGLCCVYRSEAGADDGTDPHYRNNAHLSKAVKDPCLSNFVGYYDATSLYPSSELEDMPVGTGTLFVRSARSEDRKVLVREKRGRNALESQESRVIQYLVQGGHSTVMSSGFSPDRRPDFVGSSIHAGAGQQVFGCTRRQYCDLFMGFLPQSKSGDKKEEEKTPVLLMFHNYHGTPWHYTGHLEECPLSDGFCFTEIAKSRQMDRFRFCLAKAWSEVRPKEVLFSYSTSYTCNWFHQNPIPSLKISEKTYASLEEWLQLEGNPEETWLSSPFQLLQADELKEKIRRGEINGFVTVRGGREHPAVKVEDPVGSNFGFCVQNYAPSPAEISPFTKNQIARHLGVDEETEEGRLAVEKFLTNQPMRTLNASSFFSEETVSTTYLRWLMKERKFDQFEISHFLHYEFRNWSKEFLEPILQQRHQFKQQGNAIAAECLKLIVNGSYGYNGLESSNYDTVKLIPESQIQKKLKGQYRAQSLKHLSLVGMVRLKIKGSGTRNLKKKRKNKTHGGRRRRRQKATFEFANLEADEGSEDNDDDDDDGEERADLEAEEEEESGPVDGVSVDDIDFLIPYVSDYREKRRSRLERPKRNRNLQDALTRLARLELLQRGSSSGGDTASGAKRLRLDFGGLGGDDDDDEEREGAAFEDPEENSVQDLEELLVREEEEEEKGCTSSSGGQGGENNVAEEIPSAQKSSLRRYEFLYAVSFSGELKSISNTLPRAVAVLSNSKRLFLGHLNVMLRCLDPKRAELCYIDTDSCVFSLTFADLTRCLLPSKLEEWRQANLLADESAQQSCHGKMKEEGVFARGQFKTLKIYRLYTQEEREQEQEQAKLQACYTRCKGIGRRVATKLPDLAFDSHNVDRLVVHRNTLRPTRVGEIVMLHEARSLAVPFNLKRFVTPGGLHSFPVAGRSVETTTDSDTD